LQQCLDAHPEICCKGEGHFTDSLFPLLAGAFDAYNAQSEVVGNRLQNSGLPGNAAGFTVDDVHHLMTAAIGLMFSRWAGDGQVKVIAEKTPEHIVSLDKLAQSVPSMKIIHVYRDARDEAVAVWEFNQGISQGAFQQKYPQFGEYAKALPPIGAKAFPPPGRLSAPIRADVAISAPKASRARRCNRFARC